MIKNVKSKNNISSLYLVYKGSVSNENVGFRGISHLSEHLLATALDDLQDEFQNDCIDFNAWTSESEIVFYISGLERQLAKYRDIFISKLLVHIPTKEQFEKERNIVIQELFGYFSDQTSSHYMNYLRTKYNWYGALGSEKDLENLTYENYLNFHELTYRNPSLIVNISKDFNYENKDVIFTHNYNKVKVELGEYEKDELVINDFKETCSVLFTTNDIITDKKDKYLLSFACNMLSTGLNSPLYQEVREKRNLVYSISAFVDTFTEDQFLLGIYCQTKKETSDEVVNTIKDVIFDSDQYMTKERFDIVMSMMLTQREMNNEYTPSYRKITIDKESSLHENLDKITFDKVKETYLKYINLNNISSDISS